MVEQYYVRTIEHFEDIPMENIELEPIDDYIEGERERGSSDKDQNSLLGDRYKIRFQIFRGVNPERGKDLIIHSMIWASVVTILLFLFALCIMLLVFLVSTIRL